MSSYGGSVLSINQATTSPNWELKTTANTRSSILEIGITQTVATGISMALGRPQVVGVGLPGYAMGLYPEERTDGTFPSTTQIIIAWQVPPTVPLQFYRRILCAASIGAGVIWTFARGLIVPVNNSIVLWNLSIGPILNTWFLVKE